MYVSKAGIANGDHFSKCLLLNEKWSTYRLCTCFIGQAFTNTDNLFRYDSLYGWLAKMHNSNFGLIFVNIHYYQCAYLFLRSVLISSKEQKDLG